jgi:hypothetical protein
VWDESFIFVLSSVLSIGTWFCLTWRRKDADLFGRQKWWWPLAVFWVCAAIWLGERFYLKGWNFPDLGVVLAFMFGGVFGTFVARFVLQLFGPGFSTYDGLIAAATLLLLSIAYSMPSYPGLWTALFERLGGTTIKTPLLELALRRKIAEADFVPGRRPIRCASARISTSKRCGASNVLARQQYGEPEQLPPARRQIH